MGLSTAVAVGVVPVAALVPIWLAGAYGLYRGTTTAVGDVMQSTAKILSQFFCFLYPRTMLED